MKVSPGFIVTLLFVAPSAVPATPELDAFWASCQDRLASPPPDGFYRVRQFGGSALADRLLELILTGQKTGTYALPWLYEGDAERTPVAGGYSVVTDSAGKPAAVLLTTHTRTLPYNEITEEETRYEGPNARALEVWKAIHWPLYSRALEEAGMTATEDMPVTVEQFEVVCVAQG